MNTGNNNYISSSNNSNNNNNNNNSNNYNNNSNSSSDLVINMPSREFPTELNTQLDQLVSSIYGNMSSGPNVASISNDIQTKMNAFKTAFKSSYLELQSNSNDTQIQGFTTQILRGRPMNPEFAEIINLDRRCYNLNANLDQLASQREVLLNSSLVILATAQKNFMSTDQTIRSLEGDKIVALQTKNKEMIDMYNQYAKQLEQQSAGKSIGVICLQNAQMKTNLKTIVDEQAFIYATLTTLNTTFGIMTTANHEMYNRANNNISQMMERTSISLFHTIDLQRQNKNLTESDMIGLYRVFNNVVRLATIWRGGINTMNRLCRSVSDTITRTVASFMSMQIINTSGNTVITTYNGLKTFLLVLGAIPSSVLIGAQSGTTTIVGLSSVMNLLTTTSCLIPDMLIRFMATNTRMSITSLSYFVSLSGALNVAGILALDYVIRKSPEIATAGIVVCRSAGQSAMQLSNILSKSFTSRIGTVCDIYANWVQLGLVPERISIEGSSNVRVTMSPQVSRQVSRQASAANSQSYESDMVVPNQVPVENPVQDNMFNDAMGNYTEAVLDMIPQNLPLSSDARLAASSNASSNAIPNASSDNCVIDNGIIAAKTRALEEARQALEAAINSSSSQRTERTQLTIQSRTIIDIVEDAEVSAAVATEVNQQTALPAANTNTNVNANVERVLNDGPVTMVGAVAAGTRTFARLFGQGRFQDLTELMNMQVRNLGSSISNLGGLTANLLSGAYRLNDFNSSVSSSNVSSNMSSFASSIASSNVSSNVSSAASSRPSGRMPTNPNSNPNSNPTIRNINPFLTRVAARLEPIAQAQRQSQVVPEYGNWPSAPPAPLQIPSTPISSDELPSIEEIQQNNKRARDNNFVTSEIDKRFKIGETNNNNNDYDSDYGGSKRKSRRRLIGTKKKRVIRRRSISRTKGRRSTRKQIRRRRSIRRRR